MKVESQVIVDQHATVNLYLDLVHTARHMLGVSFILNFLKIIILIKCSLSRVSLIGFSYFLRSL